MEPTDVASLRCQYADGDHSLSGREMGTWIGPSVSNSTSASLLRLGVSGEALRASLPLQQVQQQIRVSGESFPKLKLVVAIEIQGGGGSMATVRAVAQRYALARGVAPAVQQYSRALVSEGDDGRRFGAQLNSAVEDQGTRSREKDVGGKRTWNGRWMAAGAFSLSFAASTMSVACGKERVADKFAPNDVVLYQYDACPFCNKVKGRSPAF